MSLFHLCVRVILSKDIAERFLSGFLPKARYVLWDVRSCRLLFSNLCLSVFDLLAQRKQSATCNCLGF